MAKNLPANAGNSRGVGLISMLGRAPREGNGYSLQYSCLENPQTEEPVRIQSISLQESDATE